MVDNSEYTECIGCGKSFYIVNNDRLIGSPEFNTLCHRKCCGKSDLCKQCGVLKNKENHMATKSAKNIYNVLVSSIQALTDDNLEALEGAVLHIGPLIALEQDKRAGVISDYSIHADTDNLQLKLRVKK